MKKNTTIQISKVAMHQFEAQLPFILSHIIDGEIKKGHSYGIHFYVNEKHQIQDILKPANHVGVWEAFIKMRHPKTNNWVAKKLPSTFFPITWSYELLLLKLEEAFINKTQTHSYKCMGTTSCGIQVVFLFRDNRVVACYPIYETTFG